MAVDDISKVSVIHCLFLHNAHVRTYARTYAHIHPLTHVHTHTQTHSLTHARARAPIHITYTSSPSCFLSSGRPLAPDPWPLPFLQCLLLIECYMGLRRDTQSNSDKYRRRKLIEE